MNNTVLAEPGDCNSRRIVGSFRKVVSEKGHLAGCRWLEHLEHVRFHRT